MSIWLELEAGGRKAGTVCARDYRNGDGCPLIVRRSSEDVMVANVFGMLRLLEPTRWLRRLLNAAFGTRRFTHTPIEPTSMAFWQRIGPASQRRVPEGDSEIDVLLRFADCAVFIEAKYLAKLSSGTTHDGSRDQLIRLLEVAYDNTVCGLWRCQPYVLVIGTGTDEPELVTRYRDPRAIVRQLGHHSADEARVRATLLSRRVGYLSWSAIRELLAAPAPGLHVTEQRVLAEVGRYLEHRIQAAQRPDLVPIDGVTRGSRTPR